MPRLPQSAHAIAGVGIVACSHPTRHQPGSASCDLRADGSRRVAVGGSLTPTCPSWHFLPGPYQGDAERRDCPNASTHAAQRQARSL